MVYLPGTRISWFGWRSAALPCSPQHSYLSIAKNIKAIPADLLSYLAEFGPVRFAFFPKGEGRMRNH
jgi:hypothetical protein